MSVLDKTPVSGSVPMASADKIFERQVDLYKGNDR